VIPAIDRDVHGFVMPVQFKHHDYESMEMQLQLLAKNFPNITRLYSAGRSVRSKELYVIEISDNPGIHEPGEL
jgi:carboxypeptidase D